MKNLATLLLAVVLIVQAQYLKDGNLYVDYTLNGEQYQGVAYDDMFDDINSAMCDDYESQVQQ